MALLTTITCCSSDYEKALSINDPLFNYYAMYRQCLLLEDHLSNIRLQCRACIFKHMNTIIALLEEANQLDGYSIYRTYRSIFPAVNIRSIYYHLKKGCSLGEFKVNRIEKEKGNFGFGGDWWKE